MRPWTGRADGPGLYVDAGRLAPDPTRWPAFERVGEGVVRLPFDPEAAAVRLVTETYAPHHRPWHTWLPIESGRIPGALKDRLLTRSLRPRLADAAAFPRWPVEPSVENLRALVLEAARAAGAAPAPAPLWPDGKRWAATLSHDLDTESSVRRDVWRPFADLEEAHGLRSSWHVCTAHARSSWRALEELARRGHEIAWHGPRHDYRFSYRPPEAIRAAAREAVAALAPFGLRGLRSVNFLRTPGLYAGIDGVLGYDSSPRDTAAELNSGHVREGCCTVFPFFSGNLVVLPVTVPDDLSLRALAGDDADATARRQEEKLAWIRGVGGLAMSLTHPEPWISARPGAFAAYGRLVASLAADRECWTPLPRDVEAWWRRRHAVPFGAA